MAKGDITPAAFFGAGADRDCVVLQFNDGDITLGLNEDDGLKTLLALGEALGEAQKFRTDAGGGEYALHASRLGVSLSPDGHEVQLRFWVVGDYRVNVAVPVAALPQLIDGLVRIVRAHSASAKPTN